MNEKSKTVELFLDDIRSMSNWQYEAVSHIRGIFSKHKKLSEGIKYGGLVFLKNEQLVGGLFVYKNHISVEFGRGAELTDTREVLEGKGKFRRHIKINHIDDIQHKYLDEYINEIVKLEPA